MKAALDEIDEEGISDPTREYARQLCDPFKAVIEEFAKVAPASEGVADEGDADLGSLLVLMRDLRDPFSRFGDELADINPPKELASLHNSIRAQIAYFVAGIDLIAEGGFFAVLALGDPPPEVEEPPDFEDALLVECGENLLGLLEDEGLFDLFGGDTTPAP